MALLVLLLSTVLFGLASRSFSKESPGNFQHFLEFIVGGLKGLLEEVVGHRVGVDRLHRRRRTHIAHATHQTPDQVKATLSAWGEIKQMALEFQTEGDLAAKQKCEDELREEWGGQYRIHTKMIGSMLDGTAGQKLKDNLLNGRLEDGTKVINSPEAMCVLLALALEKTGGAPVVHASNEKPLQSIDDRISEIEKRMRTDRKAYNDPKRSRHGVLP